ncbi:MAG TPA: (2Fe-2S) ferredoxin domain-containing protein [Syntrophales bacterium]|nr:(2Fe-2S) ferredoxin domain-containing protein [Geobacteraceae bacterium]HPQ44014.1 (2Fe-2S) ferredoxin domain-containing protein [Syntrophales bacterium]
MLLITICVGSSCSLRGSDELASELFNLIKKEKLEGLVDIVGAFCMDSCSKGVSVRVGDHEFSGILPEDAESFFYKEIMSQVENTLLIGKKD